MYEYNTGRNTTELTEVISRLHVIVFFLPSTSLYLQIVYIALIFIIRNIIFYSDLLLFSCIFYSPAHAAPHNLDNKVMAKLLHFSIVNILMLCTWRNYIPILRSKITRKSAIYSNLSGYIFGSCKSGPVFISTSQNYLSWKILLFKS